MFGDFLLGWDLGSRTAWQLSPRILSSFSLHDECLDSLARTWVGHLVARSWACMVSHDFYLKDPHGSLPYPYRLMWSEVTRVSWWMAHYGGLSPKRHYAWSNSPAIKRLDKGRLQWKKLKATLPYTLKTVKKYVDSENRIKYHGTSQLRTTEWLG